MRASLYGSLTVSLQDAPQTSALFLRGSVVSRQLTLPLPLAFGSRYLNRQFSSAPLSGFWIVASKMAPLLFSMTLPGPHPAGASPEPAHDRTLLASPVGCQSVLFAGTDTFWVPRLITNLPDVPSLHLKGIVSVLETLTVEAGWLPLANLKL